jgi:hypothetical protein
VWRRRAEERLGSGLRTGFTRSWDRYNIAPVGMTEEAEERAGAGGRVKKEMQRTIAVGGNTVLSSLSFD